MFTRNSTLEVCVHWVPILREITILISKEAVQDFTPTSSGRVFLLIHILPQHRPLWTFLILVFLIFVRWYPSIILICIPLMIMDAKQWYLTQLLCNWEGLVPASAECSRLSWLPMESLLLSEEKIGGKLGKMAGRGGREKLWLVCKTIKKF